MDVQTACEMLSRVQNGKRPPLTDTEKAELAVMTDKPINSEEIRCKHCGGKIYKGHPRDIYAWWHENPGGYGQAYCRGMENIAEPINSVSPASTKEK